MSERRGALRRVLLVDDAEALRGYLARLLELRGFEVDSAGDGERALALLSQGSSPDVVLLDVLLPGQGGLETLRRMRERHPALPVVMISVIGRAATIVEAMQAGAVDYLTKPCDEDELVSTLERAFARARGEPEPELGVDTGPLWGGETLGRLRGLLSQIADTDVTVLIQGESGVGKEIVAREVHETSRRREGPFVKVNCAALPGSLLESELFGYERGAFTGAFARKTGKFEQASAGTIFLDEIGEMSAALQAKLLHVIQDGRFARLGGNREVEVDARVVAATNRDLGDLVRTGGFREDLFFRLNVVNIVIPPLRERRDEVPALIDHFLRRLTVRYGRPTRRLSSRLVRLLDRHPFPGNIRELENLLKRIVVLESEEPVLRDFLAGEAPAGGGTGALERLLEEVERSAGELPLREVGRRVSLEAERSAIERALFRTKWNRKQAARILGVSYKTLLLKIRECGLEAG